MNVTESEVNELREALRKLKIAYGAGVSVVVNDP